MKNDEPISVLLLEDEALIAFDLEDHLRDAGFRVADVLASCADASTWLEANTPDIVVLDVRLSDGICDDVVKTIRGRKIPFIVHSGNEFDPGTHHAAFLDGVWVLKPSPPDVLVKAVAALVSKSRMPSWFHQDQDSA